ncbi:hypothetical protein [Polynucleobacter sp. HIN7]|uniref:hypothetical protein n=1 Tax=Polynucleobacter sp. HIN7 TaxID=3047866 RepID=UPI0025722CED|nr:hypothetical protein [Polynucleobacter sp. HIN7]BEI37346.1 hypothetical protein PHIN7_10700 [Polynucleobacter sp. HIN7]
MSQSLSITSTLTWKKVALYASVAILLMLVFALYFIPEVVIGLAEQAWALCGW